MYASSSKNKKYKKWSEEMDKSFIQTKQVIAQETILVFPDWDKPFIIFTYSSEFQLGGVVTKNEKPLVFYSRKLNKAQTNFTIEEK